MDQLCAHVILLPVKSMHTSPICCSSQADKLALCTHKQTAHFPDIRDCFQSERQSLGSFTQKKKRKKKQKERKNCLFSSRSNLSVYTHRYTISCLHMYLYWPLWMFHLNHTVLLCSVLELLQARKFFILVKLVYAGLSLFYCYFFSFVDN